MKAIKLIATILLRIVLISLAFGTLAFFQHDGRNVLQKQPEAY